MTMTVTPVPLSAVTKKSTVQILRNAVTSPTHTAYTVR